MSTNSNLLEVVLKRHIKIKCIPAVPKADADESAATCGQTTAVTPSELRKRKVTLSTL